MHDGPKSCGVVENEATKKDSFQSRTTATCHLVVLKNDASYDAFPHVQFHLELQDKSVLLITYVRAPINSRSLPRLFLFS